MFVNYYAEVLQWYFGIFFKIISKFTSYLTEIIIFTPN